MMTGSIGLLHSLLNLPPSTTSDTTISPDSPLSTFKLQSLPLSPLSRAKLLDETPFFEAAHQSSVAAGQSRVPEGVEERETDLHFIAFVKGGHVDG
jgi:ubiquitin carboxyl-terminal hydrolase L3